MDIAAYTENLKRLEADLVKGDLLDNTVVPAAEYLLAAIKKRVFKDGLNSENGQIGNYSRKEIWAEKQMFAKPAAFKARGKNNYAGNTIGDVLIPTVRLKTTSIKKNPVNYKSYTLVKPNLKERKTMYLEEGYKELRDVQSLQTNFIDLKYRGNLMRSYQAQKVANAVLLGLTDSKNALIRKGLEGRFGTILSPTTQEIDDYIGKVNYSFTRLTRGYLEGVTATVE